MKRRTALISALLTPLAPLAARLSAPAQIYWNRFCRCWWPKGDGWWMFSRASDGAEAFSSRQARKFVEVVFLRGNWFGREIQRP